MEAPDLLRKVRKLEIRAKGLMNQLLSGEYHSAFRGMGMTFSEVRAYQFGDDIRNIDWNVTARTGDPYVKIFEEERELTVMLLIDISASQYFGSRDQNKYDLTSEIAALLALSAISNQDKVGAILFSDEIEKYIPPQKGSKALLHILRAILHHKPSGKQTNLEKALDALYRTQKKRSIVFILSDFITPSFQKPLQLAAQKHDVIGIAVNDVLEKKFPSVGLIHAMDAETGEYRYIDTSDHLVARFVSHQFYNKQDELKSLFSTSGADMVHIQTEEDYSTALHLFFQKRTKRM